jgi:hypothetical protein
MLNSKPNNKNYKNGLYVPINMDKILKLNDKGGFYYRSGLEHKFMIYLDNNSDVVKWNPEIVKIPYIRNAWDNKLQETHRTEHCYYPDFYYEIIKKDGTIARVLAEIKPYKDTIPPKIGENPTLNQIKNFEYDLKMYSKNMDKWRFAFEWCKVKGYEFIIIPDKKPCHLCNQKGCNYCAKGWINYLK